MKENQIKKIPLFTFFIEYVSHRFLKFLAVRNKKKGYAQLLCLPYDYVSQRIITNGLYEDHLLESLFFTFLKDRKNDFSEHTALDVGANIGNHSCFFSKIFKEVISFEPNDTTLCILKANVFINHIDNVFVQSFGLGEKEEELPFVEDKNGNLGGSHFCKDGEESTTESELKTLPIKKGDDVIKSNFSNSTIDLIKLDVEEFEFSVLKGLKGTIQKFHPVILFESNTSEGAEGGKEIFNFLKENGYEYFYIIEAKGPKSKNKLMRVFERLTGCSDLYVSRLDDPEDRAYDLIIATATEVST